MSNQSGYVIDIVWSTDDGGHYAVVWSEATGEECYISSVYRNGIDAKIAGYNYCNASGFTVSRTARR